MNALPRPSAVGVMLLATILLWSLNLSASKYVLEHGFEPMPFAIVRYGAAGLIFVLLTLAVEGTLRIERRHFGVLAFASIVLCLNQLALVYALDLATASAIGLILGAIPIFAALYGVALGRERLGRNFWLAAAISFGGVALVAVGAPEAVSGSYAGVALGVCICLTWAAYSVAIAPLMDSYTPWRVSAIVLPLGWIFLLLGGLGELDEQRWDLGWAVWALVAFSTVGPLVVTTVLWFHAIHRIGAARATLAANLQPFIAAVLAVLLLSEPLGLVQIAGGALIATGLVVARRKGARASNATSGSHG